MHRRTSLMSSHEEDCAAQQEVVATRHRLIAVDKTKE
jgi:hypothetical protein